MFLLEEDLTNTLNPKLTLEEHILWFRTLLGKGGELLQTPFLSKLSLYAFNNCNLETEIKTNEGKGNSEINIHPLLSSFIHYIHFYPLSSIFIQGVCL